MTMWTATVEWHRSTGLAGVELEQLQDRLGEHRSPSVRHVQDRTWAATVVVEATTLRQALDRAIRVVEQAAHVKATGVAALRTVELDGRDVTVADAVGPGVPRRPAPDPEGPNGAPGSPPAAR